ncbi:hypothetical protein evm_012278 [Chilo suppressalis]|nr:hypothetical protein evm_012278 [Chilo suppressalis]
MGRAPLGSSDISHQALSIACTADLNSILSRFWEVEEVPAYDVPYPEDLLYEKHFVETHSRNFNGRFIVRLPFKTGRIALGSSFDNALKRFYNLERKLRKDNHLRELYIEFMRDYLQASGVSLNQLLMAGPKLQQHVEDIILRFRTHAIHVKLPQIPRYILSTQPYSSEIMGFCDASESGYAAVLVSIFVLSTLPARVAPLRRKLTIPRLELCGDLLLARLIAWLSTSPQKLRTFEGCRISQAQGLIPPAKWRYVTSATNLADCVSRGVTADVLVGHQLWWFPFWLKDDPSTWPTNPCVDTSALPGLKPEATSSYAAVEVNPLGHSLITKYSSLTQLQRITAWLLRVISNTQSVNSRTKRPVTVQELSNSLLTLVKLVQGELFADQISAINKGRSVSGPLQRLDPFIDAHGLNLTYAATYPLLLPKSYHLTHLIIDYYHLLHLHAAKGETAVKAVHFEVTSDFTTLLPFFIDLLKGCFRINYALRPTHGRALGVDGQLSTVFARSEAILNSRPLCPLTDDESNLDTLTPGHYLIGQPLVSLPEEASDDSQQGEYLYNLQQRPKWCKTIPNLMLGDLVLIKDDRATPLRWRKGRVSALYPGTDGVLDTRAYAREKRYSLLVRHARIGQKSHSPSFQPRRYSLYREGQSDWAHRAGWLGGGGLCLAAARRVLLWAAQDTQRSPRPLYYGPSHRWSKQEKKAASSCIVSRGHGPDRPRAPCQLYRSMSERTIDTSSDT